MKTDYTKPVYVLDGREYLTVNGLCSALLRKHSATAISGVSKDRKLRVFAAGRGEIIASYSVSAPEIGKPMTLTLLG